MSVLTVTAARGRKSSLPKGNRIVILSPGGGGLGDPRQRDPALVQRDVEYELVTAETARDVYGLEPEGRAAAAE